MVHITVVVSMTLNPRPHVQCWGRVETGGQVTDWVLAGGVTVAGVTALVFYWLEDTTVPGQLSLLLMMDQLNKSLISKQTACEYKILARSILEALKKGP